MLKMLLKNRRQPANVFIMLVAIVIFGFLMGLSYSIGQLKMIDLEQSSDQTIKTKLKLINSSALNEVIATRLFPTSNRYSWEFDGVANISAQADPVTRPKPFLTDSSYVYETVGGVKKSVGRYQYVILGSNSYYDYNAGTGAYTVSTAKMDSGEHLYNISNPIYVAVRSFVCLDPTTKEIAYDAVVGVGITTLPFAACNSLEYPKEQMTLTELQVTGTTDADVQINIVSSYPIQPYVPFTLPSKILNRNNTPTNQFRFDHWWSNQPAGMHYGPRGNAVPVGIRYNKLITPPAPASPYTVKVYVGGSFLTPYTLPSDAVIPSLEILFRAAIDERSLYSVSHVLGMKYTPVSTVYMGVDSIEHPGYKQEEFSGTELRKSGLFGPGYFSQTIGFPSMSLLKISGDVPCESTNQIVFNAKGQLRDADGFKNTTAYTFNYTAPTC